MIKTISSGLKKIGTKLFDIFFGIEFLFKMINYKFRKNPKFELNGKEIDYFYHSYNNNRLTERAIEIPVTHFLITQYIQNRENKLSMLEIGNVTNHYYTYFMNLFLRIDKLVVDLFEVAPNVINEDLLDFNPKTKFDIILSISTFEHFDSDRGRNADYIPNSSKFISKAADAIYKVSTSMLNPGGLFIFTCPIGYASEFDQTLFESDFFDTLSLQVKKINYYYFIKTSNITWKQSSSNDVKGSKYGKPFQGINALVVVEILT